MCILPNVKFIGTNIGTPQSSEHYVKDYKFAHKLTEWHIFVEEPSHINVWLAANSFYNSVSKAIAFYGLSNLLL